jgi:transitional endoplasmic reticulum ATPase
MDMAQVLAKNELLDAGYKIKFFMGGNDFLQKYRASGSDNKTYCLIIYNSAKLLKGSFSNDELLEAEILGLFNADSIVKLVESGEMVKESHKYHYLVTNFVSGETLHEKLERDGAFSQYAAVPIVIAVLEALSLLHQHPKGIIHNNVNLKSVTLDYSAGSERPVLGGFHFAREIASKINSLDLQGLSPFYIAPELYNGVFTPQSDVFSAGVLLYHLIMGIPPWHIEIPKFQHTQDKFVQAIADNREKNVSFGVNGADDFIDDHLKNTIKKALALNIDDRFATAQEFIKYLKREAFFEGSSVEINKTSTVKADEVIGKHKKDNQSGFAAIAGMQELKGILYNDVIRALNEKDLYESYGVTIPNGMLLYGPPGCGKTFIAERFAEEVGFNFLQLKPSDLKSKWVNDTELKIAAIFKEAVDNAPSIIFIDEFDAVVPSREGNLHEMNASAVNELLTHMSNCSERGVFVIAATNRPEKIDSAILRTGRIDRIIYLPPPDFDARALMFELYLKSRPIDLGVDYEALAKLTDNYVASDIKYLVDEASRAGLKNKSRITQTMLEKVIADIRPSVTYSEIKKYELLKEKLESR